MTKYIIALVLFIGLISCKPRNHVNYGECTSYRIRWNEGNYRTYEDVYDYKIDIITKSITFEKPVYCTDCGKIMYTTTTTIQGTYTISKEDHCR